MPNLTSPDSLPYPLAGEPAAPIQENFEDLAVAAQIALAKRQRYSYVWADNAARDAQTGQVEGSEGYVLASKTDYKWTGGSWKLSLAHAEFACEAANALNNTLSFVGTPVLDAANSTSTTMAVASSNGVISITDPGLYAISTVTDFRNVAQNRQEAATGRTFLDMATANSIADLQRASIAVGEDRGSLSVGNVRVLNPASLIYFQFYRTVAATSALTRTRIRITRLG